MNLSITWSLCVSQKGKEVGEDMQFSTKTKSGNVGVVNVCKMVKATKIVLVFHELSAPRFLKSLHGDPESNV